ncbi:thioredoxin family protein [Dactylosporangium sp. NPDC051541]|uniref:thioredoxin family protein n=1 Tax=Dactylosporangium sp. NPDC051541 TaxID=3363977 RepID=UPI0037ADFFC1
MQVALVYTPGCPNWQPAGERLRLALDQVGRSDVEIRYAPVDGETLVAGFAGSPTFLMDGVDLFDGPPSVSGATCRLYATSRGLAGVPDVAQLAAGLAARCTPRVPG